MVVQPRKQEVVPKCSRVLLDQQNITVPSVAQRVRVEVTAALSARENPSPKQHLEGSGGKAGTRSNGRKDQHTYNNVAH